MILPASFEHCPRCGRLNVRDALNPTARCTADCRAARPRWPFRDSFYQVLADAFERMDREES